MSERKPIPGVPGYFVDELGNVYNARWTKPLAITERTGKGYCVMHLKWEDKIRGFRVHRLVAAAYMGLDLFDTTIEVHHRDENKENNAVTNLEVMTSMEHILEHSPGYGDGTTKTCTKCHATKSVGEFYLKRGRPAARCKACWNS